jgi:hypothetical protein
MKEWSVCTTTQKEKEMRPKQHPAAKNAMAQAPNAGQGSDVRQRRRKAREKRRRNHSGAHARYECDTTVRARRTNTHQCTTRRPRFRFTQDRSTQHGASRYRHSWALEILSVVIESRERVASPVLRLCERCRDMGAPLEAARGLLGSQHRNSAHSSRENPTRTRTREQPQHSRQPPRAAPQAAHRGLRLRPAHRRGHGSRRRRRRPPHAAP